MVGIGESRGCKVVALLTAMDRPLGRAAGNALEVREAVAGLRGHGPEDLMEVTFALGIEMLRVAGLATDAATARHLLRDTIQSGRALERLMQVVEAQGGDPAQIEHPERLPSAPVQELFTAPEDGVVVGIEPRAVGRAIVALGGGRATMDDVIDPSVGFVFRAVAGEAIKRGQPLVEIHARTRDDAEGAARALAAAITLGEHARLLPLVSHRVTSAGVEELS
jgi:thymidine phosphorylase